MIKVVIIDLDGTLIDTSALEDMRAAGKWGEVSRKLNNCKVYDDMAGLLITARSSNVKVAIFTNSPSHYAKKLLDFFEITVDFVVAYHDVKNHKPLTEGVETILSHFNVEAKEAIYIGDSELDKTCSVNANVEFFKVDWGSVSGIEDSRIGIARISELIGSQLPTQTVHNVRSEILQKGNKLHLGYYLDGLKHEVWAFKDGAEGAVDRWTNKVISISDSFPNVDVVVRALGHLEKHIVKKSKPLDLLCTKLAMCLGAAYLPELLSKDRTLKKSAFCTARERKAQLFGSYTASPQHSIGLSKDNLTFLVVDDVYTSGATSEEICRAILDKYPFARIYIFTLVKTLYREEAKKASAELQHNSLLFSDLYTIPSVNSNDLNKEVFVETNTLKRKLENKKYSANYSNTNHNFIFNNLPRHSIASEPNSRKIFGVVQILKNMLQRGSPTVASRKLRNAFGLDIQESGHEFTPFPLISTNTLKWERIIRGDIKNDHYPAQYFFEHLLPKHLGKYEFVKQLTVPEVQIFDMTQVYVEKFQNRQVDFFIPHIGLIIEIDGQQHQLQLESDKTRDEFTKTLGLKTIRFTTHEIESENTSFIKKMEWIRAYIEYIANLEEKGILIPPNGITLNHYNEAYNVEVEAPNVQLQLTASIRLQLLLLELLERGVIRLSEKQTLTIINRDQINFVQDALDDLNEQLENLLRLQNIETGLISLEVEEVSELSVVNHNSDIVIDFSIFERFSDEHQVNPGVIYSRTDYFDFYRQFTSGDINSIDTSELVEYDYFQLSCTSPITYDLDLSPDSSHRQALRYFLKNLFLPFLEDADFREGQIGIIGTALSRNSTIGLLPTGSGKSICYQLSAILQPSVSFVVCPIKSLMYDQKADLDSIGFSRSNYITSDLKAEEKSKIQSDFGRGKYFFVFISPERFQTHAFRSQMSSVGLDLSFAYAVIDEAHCLSEWGHDFRTSYLNLSNAINKLAPSSSYIGLTATASVNVLKDIQSEFSVPDEFVRTPLDFTRKELSFHVLDDLGRKRDELVELVEQMDKKWNSDSEDGIKAGIIFSPTVNGDKGCYDLSGHLTSVLGKDVRFYSGSAPKNFGLNGDAFDKYKREVQNDFKIDKYDLLAATKAFGMGVNKGNIAYTIHYGIPGSMEALYQEAGRAGRDKTLFMESSADCYVLLSKEPNKICLDKIWDASTKVDDLKEQVKNLDRRSDVNTNLFLMTVNLDPIREEYKLLDSIYQYIKDRQEQNSLTVSAREFRVDKFKFEKSIYRLSQLGIISDWVVEDFFSGVLYIEFQCLTESQLEESIISTIRKYEPTFEFNDIFESENQYYKQICTTFSAGKIDKTQLIFLILLLWSYEHFVYNRRQSLKTVYEQCCELADGKICESEFKERLEGYFKFDESSQLLLNLAENSANSSLWLSVFFEESSGFSELKEPSIISLSERTKLREQLSRFLESYKNNACLNYLSGVVRLAANQFNDADGKRRMSSALDYLISKDRESALALVEQTFLLKSLFSEEARSQFAQLVHEKFDDIDLLELVNEELDDAYSYHTLLLPLADKLKTIYNKYQEINW